MSIPGESQSNEPKPCPSEVRGFIARMETMMYSPEYNHAGIPSQLAVDLIKGGHAKSFTDIEHWLREMGSRVYFIATPLDAYGPHWLGRTKCPWDKESSPEFTLWIGINGEAEAALMLGELGIDATENLERLNRTGVLSLD